MTNKELCKEICGEILVQRTVVTEEIRSLTRLVFLLADKLDVEITQEEEGDL